MRQSKGTDHPVRLVKKRRLRLKGLRTFRDLHAPRSGEGTSRGAATGGSGFPRASDAIASPAPQGGGEVVVNHVLV